MMDLPIRIMKTYAEIWLGILAYRNTSLGNLGGKQKQKTNSFISQTFYVKDANLAWVERRFSLWAYSADTTEYARVCPEYTQSLLE